jgi:hypothetical protein
LALFDGGLAGGLDGDLDGGFDGGLPDGAAVAVAGGRRRPPQPFTKYCWAMEKQFDTNQ